jgi:hypothetical protein
MKRPTGARNIVAYLCAGIASLVVAGCGQEELVSAAPAAQAVGVTRTWSNLTQSQVCPDMAQAATNPACQPSGGHGSSHGGAACTACHAVGGRLAFPLGGAAYGPDWTPGKPLPTFDATSKTCSNIACHAVPAGMPYSYYFPGGDGEPVLNTVYTYGNAGGTTPSWYATGIGCGACHPNPPTNGSTGSNAWHSGYHGGQGPTGARNQCQFCHPDARGSNGQGTTITNSALHANGAINVQASFTSTCFGCH